VPRNDPFAPTDLGNAERLVASHGDDLRYAPGLGWFAWEGTRWRPDIDGEVMRRVKRTVREIPHEADELNGKERTDLLKWAIQSESEPRLRAAVKLAETEAKVVVSVAQLDADPWLLNAPNGTIDLRTAELREHRREDLLTKITGARYIPGAESKLFDDFLRKTTGGKLELAAFLARAVGYSATGHTGEEVLFFPHGPTATGKSTMLGAIQAALGDYAATADFETFLKRRGDPGVRNDIARLAGKRIILSTEVDEGKQLAEGLLKMLTGGDAVVARFMYRELFEFLPTFKLWLAANARPRVNADDAAMWRRILQLPFTNVIPEGERDERVKIALRTDPNVQTAVLAWAVKGCLDWTRHGLAVPAIVRDYTAAYRAEVDELADWINEHCVLQPDTYAFADELHTSHAEWAERSGERPLSKKGLGSKLQARGCTPDKASGGRRIWRGITLCHHTPGRIDPRNEAGWADQDPKSTNLLSDLPHEGFTETAAQSALSAPTDAQDPRAPAQGTPA
jgi:putative DNA primase/helicase